MGTRNTPEQNTNRAQCDQRPHVLLLLLVQGAGPPLLRDTMKGAPVISPNTFYYRMQMEYCAITFVDSVL